ncbi:hypothetical protein OEZ84_28410, partial [Leclercia adecarboxylata]|uniref:hypothetical protein n=1 Tax=Leclercia adecarboxylata TaxID=83655 RepID=UPI00234CC4B1
MLTSEGFSDPSCSVGEGRDFHNTFFEFLPRYRYESWAALSRYMESLRAGSTDGPLVAELTREKEAEDVDNAEEAARWAGSALRYGQVLQLRHKQSGKFLGVTVKEVARAEKQNL